MRWLWKRLSHPSTAGAANVFVSELDPIGRLMYSTYFGGKYMSWGYATAVDAADSVYVTGGTLSPDFPVKGGLQSHAVPSPCPILREGSRRDLP